MVNQCFTLILMEKPPPRTPDESIRRRQGDRIRQFREFRELTQQHIANELGVTKAAVSSWECGTSTPRQAHQVALAKALNSPWSALFGLDGEAA